MLAAGDGVVVFAGMVAGRPVVSIDHAGGLRTTYEPVDPSVGAGQRVARGSPIGTLLAGHAGCPVEACLHWGLRRGETYLDPLPCSGRRGSGCCRWRVHGRPTMRSEARRPPIERRSGAAARPASAPALGVRNP